MRVQIKKWGNSASIRIPAVYMEAANLSIDQEVELREEDGRLVVDPMRIPRFDLDELLIGMDDDNVHGETYTGQAVGNEQW